MRTYLLVALLALGGAWLWLVGCDCNSPGKERSRTLAEAREQTAELLGVPPETVANLHRTGQLRGVRVGKRLAWKPDTVKAYVDGLEPD